MAVSKYKVSGHEKFPFRDGWITKGLCLLETEDISVFNDKDAADKLGVGSNMVKSIRYWLSACGLVEKKGNKQVLSPLAHTLLKYDRFLEDDISWWLIHSNLAKNKEDATIWYLFFNKVEMDTFNKEEVEQLINKELSVLIDGTYSEKSVKDSIDVLLNMYSKQMSRADDPEDKNICPLSLLGLVKKDGNNYSMNQPDIRRIKEDVVLYELACMFEKEESLSIERICSGENGLSNIYRLTKTQVNQYLDMLETKGYINVNRTAGLDVVYPENVPSCKDIINNYYN